MKRFRYLIARRIVQIGILLLFAFVPSVLMGDLSASLVFKWLNLADPLAALQIFLATFSLPLKLLSGACLIALIYAILGRVFCAWVCPLNLISNFAAFIARSFGLNNKKRLFSKSTRYVILAMVLLSALFLQKPIWEQFAPYAILGRGLIYAQFGVLGAIILIFISEFISANLICQQLCPLGAFYALCARFARLKVVYDLNKCTKCAKCLKICPEVQVLGLINNHSGYVNSGECIRCGRCIELCDTQALEFNLINFIKERK